MGNNRPITTRAGQTIQYSVKERSQCLENDRFLITKKVNVAALPDTMKKQPDVPLDKIETKIERTAQEAHETYLKRIQQLRQKKKAEDEERRLLEQQEYMLRNLGKKLTAKDGSVDGENEGSGFNQKRGSK